MLKGPIDTVCQQLDSCSDVSLFREVGIYLLG